MTSLLRQAKGSSFNQSRNCAIVWGEDVTDAFLAQNKFELIIRSHQVVAGGIQVSPHRHSRLCVRSQVRRAVPRLRCLLGGGTAVGKCGAWHVLHRLHR